MPDESLWMVTGLGSGGAELRPLANGAGGAAVVVEELLLEQGDVSEGDVLRLEVDNGTAIGARIGRSAIRKIVQKGLSWEAPGKVPVAQVRVPGRDALTAQEVGLLQKAPFRLFDDDARVATGLAGAFEDAAEFLQAQLASASERESRRQSAREEQARLRQRLYDPDRFVNPYNFVPVPAGDVPREEPVGHLSRRPGLLSGTLELQLEVVTPLLLRQDAGAQRTVAPRRDGAPMVPASSLKGAVRSLVETITGSCLRSFDGDFVPGYRDVLSVDAKKGWQLAVVDSVSNGRPESLQVCDQVCWVSWDVLQAALPSAGVRTGARLRVNAEPQYNATNQRLELRAPGAVTAAPDGEWVLLVTHTGARPAGRTHLFAIGRLTQTRVGPVSDGGWRDYLAAVDGADSLVLSPRSLDELYQKVPSRVVTGWRLKPTDSLVPGYVLWVRVAGHDVTRLSLSHTWRHRGERSAGERLSQTFHPCGNEYELCPACRLFGAAPVAAERADGDRALPYRGHVRFTDLVGDASAAVTVETLAPMGSPRPGSGNFYLRDPEPPAAPRSGHAALAEWGSARDAEPRPLRGRKYYWHTTPRPKAPRFRAHRSHQGSDNAGSMLSTAEVVQPGSRFSGRVVVENLEPAQLGALLAALDPSLLPVEGSAVRCWHVGGGRPLGLGSVRCVELDVRVDEGSARYSAESASGAASGEQLQDWVEALVRASPQPVRDTWPSLVHLLSLDAVNPNMVSYPRAGAWPTEEGGDSPDLWKPGLKWWTHARGASTSKGRYRALPEPLAPDPTLPVDPAADDGERP